MNVENGILNTLMRKETFSQEEGQVHETFPQEEGQVHEHETWKYLHRIV